MKLNDSSQKILTLFARTSEELGASLDYSETISHVCALPVPLLADWCCLFILDEKSASLSFAHCQHRDKKLNKKFKDYFQSEDYAKRHVVMDTLRKGKAVSEIYEVPSPLAGFTLNLPLIKKSEVVGFLTLGSKKHFTPEDTLLAEEIAKRAAFALSNARLYQRSVTAEAELIRAKEMAEESNRAKSQFLANISHEIRAPIGAILGFTDLLLSADNTEAERAEWTSRVKRNGDHLLRIINDILNLSKIESGELSIEKEFVNINRLFSDLKTILSVPLEDKKIKLKFILESPVPEKFITDETRLRQILINIIGNALKFTDEGCVAVTISFQKDSGLLYFNIQDTGPGLTETQASQLFQPYVQAKADHSKRGNGTGLGLVISKNLARLLGGDLELVYSAPGLGSKFNICIKPQLPDETKFITELK